MNHKRKNNYYVKLLLSIVTVFYFSVLPAKQGSFLPVVEINSAQRTISYETPWEMSDYDSFIGSGVVIEGNYVLTVAHNVKYPLEVIVRKAGAPEYYEAKVAYVNDEIDLALLSINDENFFENVNPVKLCDGVKLANEVLLYGFPSGGSKLAINRGIISRIDNSVYVHSSEENLVFQTDAALNQGTSGGPAMVGDCMVGLGFALQEELQNTGYVIPNSVINQFLSDAFDGAIDGVPSPRFDYFQTHNKQLTNYYGLPEEYKGVLILKAYSADDGKAYLKKGDILVEIDGNLVAEDGTVEIFNNVRTDLSYLFYQKQIGQTINLKIWRSGQWEDIEYDLPVRLYKSRMMKNIGYQTIPDYLVIGGMVFTELTFEYLEQFEQTASVFDKYYEMKTKPSNMLPIVLTNILPHKINIGYEMEQDVLSKINGMSMNDLNELYKYLQNYQEEWLVLEFESGNIVTFSRKELIQNKQSIVERFGTDNEKTF